MYKGRPQGMGRHGGDTSCGLRAPNAFHGGWQLFADRLRQGRARFCPHQLEEPAGRHDGRQLQRLPHTGARGHLPHPLSVSVQRGVRWLGALTKGRMRSAARPGERATRKSPFRPPPNMGRQTVILEEPLQS